MAFITIIDGAAQGGTKGIFQFGVGAVAPRAGGVFQYLQVVKHLCRGGGRGQPKLLQRSLALFRHLVAAPGVAEGYGNLRGESVLADYVLHFLLHDFQCGATDKRGRHLYVRSCAFYFGPGNHAHVHQR